jgi:hypothetical protein
MEVPGAEEAMEVPGAEEADLRMAAARRIAALAQGRLLPRGTGRHPVEDPDEFVDPRQGLPGNRLVRRRDAEALGDVPHPGPTQLPDEAFPDPLDARAHSTVPM